MNRRSTNRYARFAARRRRSAFSLIELMVVIAVAMILTGVLLPALQALRNNVNRVVCASNMRQIAMAKSLFADDHGGFLLPGTIHLKLDNWKPQELMVAYTPESPTGWDGLGILFQKEYCNAYECFYCPGHRGAHPLSRYEAAWNRPGAEVIYTNYHYTGDRDWATQRVRHFRKLDTLVLLTDGLRTASDVNHRFGMNVAYGDMSVRWRSELVTVFELLPDDESGVAEGAKERYEGIWSDLQPSLGPN